MSQPIIEQPDFFPPKSGHFFIRGHVGRLEVMTTSPKEDAKGIGIICHPHPLHEGSMHNKVVYTLAKVFEKHGLHTIKFNFRGVGQSQGGFADALGETEDLYAIFEWAKQVAPELPIWLGGFSFGAFVATNGAHKIKPEQLICVAPAIAKYDFTQVEPFDCPWLIVQGTEDEVTDPTHIREFVKNYEGKPTLSYVELDGAGHFFHGQLMDLRALIEEHFVQ